MNAFKEKFKKVSFDRPLYEPKVVPLKTSMEITGPGNFRQSLKSTKQDFQPSKSDYE